MRKEIAIAVVAGVAAAVALLGVYAAFNVPLITKTFSGETSAPWCAGCPFNPGAYFQVSQTFPDGSRVHVDWHSLSGDAVVFWVVGPGEFSSTAPCQDEGSAGSCSFVATAGTYYFVLNQGAAGETFENATFSGTYTAPLL